MNLIIGLLLVVIAGVLQGSFVLPMTLTRYWKWEHTWAMFSLLGMLIFNWVIGLSVLPHFLTAIRSTPPFAIAVLFLFGVFWGAGAILFGLGMERLGMAVGYPIIMGLILSLGALIPLSESGASQFMTVPGAFLLLGTAIVVLGIVLCSGASAEKDASNSSTEGVAPSKSGLIIAVFAGILSCLPNVGLNNAADLTASAIRLGASTSMASNGAWVILFSAGFVVNFLFCLALMLKRRNANLINSEFRRNCSLVAAMSLMWIGSFYLYGIGAKRMGSWGSIVGWPIFISLAILVGNLWGLRRGEWSSAPPAARSRLNLGLMIVLVAVALFGIGSAMH